MATKFNTRRKYIDHIRNREDFKSSTGNLWARWEGNGMRYVVYSYNQWIAEYSYGAWAVNPEKYSVTTTHHQSIVAMAIDTDV